MIRFLYKYMPLREDFFSKIMIRATPAIALNDPYEALFNEKQVRDADYHQRAYYKAHGLDVPEIDEYMTNELVGVIQSEFSDLGILSFSEDNNNHLMWAHYASEHTGMVVEFDFKQPFFLDSLYEINGRKSRFGKSHLADCFEYPEKVNYRREIPNFERAEFGAPDSMEECHSEKFNRAILFTKADDWLYEKEQRSIVQLCDADSLICMDNKHVREICAKDPKIQVENRNDGKIQIIYPRAYEMLEEMGDESIKKEVYWITNDLTAPPIHLFRINPEAISAVYFGCRSQPNNILEVIENNPSLSHLKYIYRMQVNKSRYQLDAERIEMKR